MALQSGTQNECFAGYCVDKVSLRIR